MSYDFNCPHCGYGMNKDQVDIHEDDVIGEWDVNCLNCKKLLFLRQNQALIIRQTSKLRIYKMTEQEIKDGAPSGATHYWDYPASGLPIDYYKIDDGNVYVWACWLEKPDWLINNRLKVYEFKPL